MLITISALKEEKENSSEKDIFFFFQSKKKKNQNRKRYDLTKVDGFDIYLITAVDFRSYGQEYKEV